MKGNEGMTIDTKRQPGQPRRERLLEWIFLGCAVTVASIAVPYWAMQVISRRYASMGSSVAWYSWRYECVAVAFGLLLTIGSPIRSGLRIGAIRANWWKVLIVCGIPIALTAAVYPQLSYRPFADSEPTMWLISPLAQDLIFLGFLYGRFEQLLPGYIHRRVPMRWCVPLTGLFFAAWHLQNLECMSTGYVVFQLCYTFLGGMLGGLSRQWTGSIFYAAAAHMAVNFIAWAAN